MLVVSAWHVSGTRARYAYGPCDEMSCGVCGMCKCLARGSVGGERVSW